MKNNRKADIFKYFLLAVIAAIIPVFAANNYYINLFAIIGINTILVIGLNLLLGYAGQVSLGHAAFYGLGAYSSGVLTVQFGLNPWLCIIIGVIITSSVAFLIGVPSLKLKGHYLAVATLGFGIIVNIFFNEAESLTGGASGLLGIPRLELFGFKFDNDAKNYYLIWFTTLLIVLAAINIVSSRTGRALKAIHGSEIAASAMGIDVSLYKIKVFVFSAAISSIAGSLYAHYITFVGPTTFSFIVSVFLIIMVVFGGAGNIWGSIIGAALITLIPEFLHAFEEYDILIYGLILMVTMIFLPGGITGGISKILAKFKSQEARS